MVLGPDKLDRGAKVSGEGVLSTDHHVVPSQNGASSSLGQGGTGRWCISEIHHTEPQVESVSSLVWQVSFDQTVRQSHSQ